MYFEILNCLGVDYECTRQTDGQTDRQTNGQTDRIALAIAPSCSAS